MFKDASIILVAILSGIFAMFAWIGVISHFIDNGITPMLGRLLITAIALTVVSIYCMKKER